MSKREEVNSPEMEAMRYLRNQRRKIRRQREIRRKCFMGIMAFVIVIGLAVSYTTIISDASTELGDISFKYYTSVEVNYGDSLWSIAEQYMSGEHYKNQKEYIAEVVSINHLQTEDITAGQNLIVPYYSDVFVH